MNYIPIEIASQNAWPAFKQIDNDGWISRYADGYTKRANSVTILHPNSISLEEQIVKHEQAYNNEGLPCIFRLLSFNDNTQIESMLNSKGYTNGDHSLVLSNNISNKDFQPLEFEKLTVNEWMKYYCQLRNKDIRNHSTHIKIINNIKDMYLLAILRKENNIVSCGLGVVHGGFFGILDIVTHPEYRNKGYGFDLINGMLNWAVQNSADTAYVQVLADNTPAVKLYKKHGYELSYEYHYKIQNFVHAA